VNKRSRAAAAGFFIVVGAIVFLLASDAGKLAAQQTSHPAESIHATWSEVAWPFPLDQWGTGRAFVCPAASCGGKVELYLRPKLAFCNCTTGVSDDAELDRVGDLELLSPTFHGLRDGRPIAVGWMGGRSRPFEVSPRFAPARTALAVAFNDKCDVVVATVVADRHFLASAEAAALEFLNGDLVLRWVEKELGL
jgi:hypothetical protein